jgi:hypothetical protein
MTYIFMFSQLKSRCVMGIHRVHLVLRLTLYLVSKISKGMSFLGKISWMQCFVSLDRCRGKGKFLSKYHANEVTENEFSLLKCLNVSRF